MSTMTLCYDIPSMIFSSAPALVLMLFCLSLLAASTRSWIFFSFPSFIWRAIIGTSMSSRESCYIRSQSSALIAVFGHLSVTFFKRLAFTSALYKNKSSRPRYINFVFSGSSGMSGTLLWYLANGKSSIYVIPAAHSSSVHVETMLYGR